MPGTATATYADAVGDAGDAPDIARVTITPAPQASLRIRVTLATPTALGPYGWILVGFDTDSNPYTGAVLGNDFLVLANGQRAVLARWVRGRFTADFDHRPLDATLSETNLEFTVSTADLGTPAFAFSAATLRQDADLAPDNGAYRYGPAAKRARPPHHRRGAATART